MMPFYQLGAFDYPVAMALATVLGLLFGFVLQRAGFGRADVLIDQFHGTDNRVLKVMFSAIVTTTVGLGLLGTAGLVDMGAIVIPATFWIPALVGGLALGAGFAMSGYCPGTAVVGIASGHLDAVVALIGTMTGGIVFGFLWPLFEPYYELGAMGDVTFPELLGVPWPILALVVTLIAIGAFLAAEKAEVFFSQRAGVPAPNEDLGMRNKVLGGLAAVAVLALATLAIPVSEPDVAVAHAEDIDAIELGMAIAASPEDLYVVDLRDASTCAEDRIPGAMCLPEDDPDAGFLADLPATRTLVLYGAGDLAALPSSAAAYDGPVRQLVGGYAAFDATILETPAAPENPTVEQVAAYQTQAALHARFTGSAAPAAPIRAIPTAVSREVKKGGGC